MYLQALRRPYLLAEFSEASSRSSRALHSLICKWHAGSSKKSRSHTRDIFPNDFHNHSQPAAVNETAVPRLSIPKSPCDLRFFFDERILAR
jgi:hypothetical protein